MAWFENVHNFFSGGGAKQEKYHNENFNESSSDSASSKKQQPSNIDKENEAVSRTEQSSPAVELNNAEVAISPSNIQEVDSMLAAGPSNTAAAEAPSKDVLIRRALTRHDGLSSFRLFGPESHKGFLSKRTLHGKKNNWSWLSGRWKKKWFVLSRHYLRYYQVKKSFHGGFRASLIDLKHCTVVPPVGRVFKLVMNGDTMELRAENDKEAVLWHAEIVKAQTVN
jgi:hypothetical protein